MRVIRWSLVALLTAATASTVVAGEVEIVEAKAHAGNDRTYTFDVTVKHGDTGWDHYANAWDVVTEDGTVLGKRTLHHPHVNEQPFTRSLLGVAVPASTTFVLIRAYDSVHGLSDKTYKLELKSETPAKAKPKRKKARGSH